MGGYSVCVIQADLSFRGKKQPRTRLLADQLRPPQSPGLTRSNGVAVRLSLGPGPLLACTSPDPLYVELRRIPQKRGAQGAPPLLGRVRSSDPLWSAVSVCDCLRSSATAKGMTRTRPRPVNRMLAASLAWHGSMALHEEIDQF